MSLDFLVVYQPDYKKIRIGSSNDGGYILAEGLEYDCIISCGIANDINFEKDILTRYPNTRCISYDGTIDKLPEQHDGVEFVKKNISYFSSDKTTTLVDVIQNYHNILLKMDIESYEYRWLQIMTPDLLQRIKQIVIEFHFPFTDVNVPHFDAPLPIQQKLETLQKLASTHTLIHLHPNNCCGTHLYFNITVPNVFECTYIRKDAQTASVRSAEPIPGPLDRPNVALPDIVLRGYPFTTNPY